MLAAAGALLGAAPGRTAAAARPSTPGLSSAPRGLDVLPFPGTPDAAPATNIDFPAIPARQIASITAVGSRSGLHSGRLSAQPAGHGTAFTPNRPFTPGETVSVAVALRTPAAGTASGAPHATRLHYTFAIARVARLPTISPAAAPLAASSRTTHSFITAPRLKPPIVTLSGRDTDARSGHIFLDAQNSGQPAAYFIDHRADLIWYKPSSTKRRGPSIFNVRVQGYHGHPVLTYWQGRVVPPGVGKGKDLILNEHYQTIHTVTAGDGYRKRGTDLHEFTLGRQGHEDVAFVTVAAPTAANLTSVGGPANGTVLDSIIQEIDVATNKVVWEWNALHHVPINASYQPYVSGQPYDYFHLNSIEQLSNGRIVISARNTWAVYSIDKSTGKIAWQLGGKHSSFRLGSGVRFFWQHHATLHNNGLLTLFDDGAPPPEEQQSRALEIHIGTHTRQATLIHAYTHNPPTLAYGEGSAEVLGNHDVFVGWGSRQYFSEYAPGGSQIFSGSFRTPVQSYRAYRFNNWVGLPLQAPAVAVRKASTAHHFNVYASWNGSTRVAKWRVLGSGSRHGSFSPVGRRVSWSSFQTTIEITSRDRWFKVEALTGRGRLLAHGTSRVVSP
ncbi:MAG: aryl-sulfate sulfotransferase [Solirubrobacterales bacterium]|nr:aryl-sulfate sulfotransferase [Solirubrobacterales bacterium]